MKKLNAVITGASKGIGWAIANKFAEQGFNLVICSRSEEELEQCAEMLLDTNPDIEVKFMAADLSKKDLCKDFGDFCLEAFDQIDVLVNNTGVYFGGELLEEEEGALESMIETNLYSAYHLTRKIAPSMVERRSGYIINMASIASFMAYPNGGSYSISKFAMRGFSMTLREELKNYGIKVTTVMPGATWSNSWAGADLPRERLMEAEDIAEAVWSIFELSDAAVLEELIIRPQLGDL